MLILDSNHVDVIMFEYPRCDNLLRRINAAREHTVHTTIITVQENLEGWLSKVNGRQLTPARQVPYYDNICKLILFFGKWDVLPFNEAAAVEFTWLQSLRLGPIGTNDLKIAAIANCHNAIILTRNTKDFRRTTLMPTQDWLQDDPSDALIGE